MAREEKKQEGKEGGRGKREENNEGRRKKGKETNKKIFLLF